MIIFFIKILVIYCFTSALKVFIMWRCMAASKETYQWIWPHVMINDKYLIVWHINKTSFISHHKRESEQYFFSPNQSNQKIERDNVKYPKYLKLLNLQIKALAFTVSVQFIEYCNFVDAFIEHIIFFALIKSFSKFNFLDLRNWGRELHNLCDW